MDETGAGTVIMVAIAAVLWFLYLLPTWGRRREYLATERTATRLQQTMRVMAETAEVPETVRVAVTAREAARRERVMLAEQRRADVLAAQQAQAIHRATPRSIPGPAARASAESLRRARMRRTRALASLLMLAATMVSLVQIWLMSTTGIIVGSWIVLGSALAGGGIAIAVQRRLDALRMLRVTREPRVATPVTVDVPLARAQRSAWTPVAVPPPLYLSWPQAQRSYSVPDTARLLGQAATRSEDALRAAHAEPEVVPFRPSRFAAMGIVDPATVSAPDLDEARRRRSAG